VIEGFEIEVPEEMLEDLRNRLRNTRWPDEVEGAGWDYGTPLSFLRDLVEYWLDDYDWEKERLELNRLPQFRTEIEGHLIHFVHVRGKGPAPLPLVLTSGWPSSFAEMRKIIGPLTDPTAYGGAAGDSFDLVIPSLPGFGFSERPLKRGSIPVDRLWRRLMKDELGYSNFVAHGTDIGARVTSALGRNHGDVVKAIHLGSVDLDWPDPAPDAASMTAAERDYVARVATWGKEEGAYKEIQATFPQTLAYALNDSPAGLASWIVEKYYRWSDRSEDFEALFTKDELLTNVMIYWLTGTINSSMRRYYETRHDPLPGGKGYVGTPTAIAMFPGERDLLVPREWAERAYRVLRWTDLPSGGHFPAQERPQLLVEDLREFFRDYR
jgi:microsomal epoxide hydrolase